jgi:periplasmic divalent cation tolerance protein
MQTPEYAVILVTASHLQEARKIAAVLLDKHKAACVNIVPRVHSSFWWQGKIGKAEESLLVIKKLLRRRRPLLTWSKPTTATPFLR